MRYPYFFIIGCSLAGMLVPEFFVMISGGKCKAPVMQNLICFLAAGLIAAAFVIR